MADDSERLRRDTARSLLTELIARESTWTDECESAGIKLASVLLQDGLPQEEVADQLVSCGVSRRGARQLLRTAHKEAQGARAGALRDRVFFEATSPSTEVPIENEHVEALEGSTLELQAARKKIMRDGVLPIVIPIAVAAVGVVGGLTATSVLWKSIALGVAALVLLIGIVGAVWSVLRYLKGTPTAPEDPAATCAQFYGPCLSAEGIVPNDYAGSWVCPLDAAKQDFSDYASFVTYWRTVLARSVVACQNWQGNTLSIEPLEADDVLARVRVVCDVSDGSQSARMSDLVALQRVGTRWYLASGRWQGLSESDLKSDVEEMKELRSALAAAAKSKP